MMRNCTIAKAVLGIMMCAALTTGSAATKLSIEYGGQYKDIGLLARKEAIYHHITTVLWALAKVGISVAFFTKAIEIETLWIRYPLAIFLAISGMKDLIWEGIELWYMKHPLGKKEILRKIRSQYM